MSKLIDKIKKCDGAVFGDGISTDEIQKLEKETDTLFADDYKEYLQTFKIAAINGHELTGMSNSNRLRVSTVTIDERKRNINVNNDYYVIEVTNIDDIIIWQDKNGKIYMTTGEGKLKELHSSLCDYISSLMH